MSIGDDVLAHVPFWRAESESLMVDEAEITRVGAPSAIYSGRCGVRPASPPGQLAFDGDAGSVQVAITFPYTTTAVAGDLITITESDDPMLVDMVFRIAGVSISRFNLYREYQCEVVDE